MLTTNKIVNTQPEVNIKRGKRLLNNTSLQQHAQVMREAKRLREQIRVRAVNGEYTHLNHTLGLKKQSRYLPKISKQQTLKTCIEHIKLLRTELGELMNLSTIGKDSISDLRDTQTIPILQRQLYMPNYFPLQSVNSENESYTETFTDDVMHFPHYPYILPYMDTEMDAFLRLRHEDSSSASELYYNTSDTLDSDFSAGFQDYTDSFCSTPESSSSSYSWLISSDWANLGDN